ncbi:ABC transporter permease [Cellulomonas hominis]|jgi:ABC-2 type transport system permease protein|uniref:Transport permease protein n=1 Tax=Cellulomonas hominis TaxID=156981 RepID=A0A511FEV6_9CELL|nr:ABC transporter permease [Cellulomonas hominis]MBB5472637.1 ABC-2 type transport system permease protein [Cellulomonas hominis]MBU5421813.1 ABC transporter permease [Cellulomonas hominis]NKY07463.1 ABC transporter permease [Cellulomonas hominis]NKY10728.1 ABC transporter permease [Cellulomonas hominis]GEL46857.1 transport permease protein [Cellulomonas hominis]
MSATSPRVLARVTAVEGRLALREPSNVFFAVLFPAVLLAVLGLAMPWGSAPYSEDDPLLSQINGITGYTPIVLTLAVGTVALSMYPITIATYRGTGVLRRLSTTPLPPSRLLIAQILVSVAALLVAAVLALVVGLLVVDVSAPTRPGVVLLAFVLTAAATFGVGSLIAARAPTAGAATGIGMTTYFVSLFFAGVWLPLPIMPEVVQRIAGWTPLGAGSQAMLAGWVGDALPVRELLVMAGWAVVLVPLAARLFRWR